MGKHAARARAPEVILVRMGSWRGRGAAAFGLLLVLAARSSGAAGPLGCGDGQAIDASLFLVGDAGDPRPNQREPALDSLRYQVGERALQVGAERVAVAFLGDNVYERGLPPEGDAQRADAERRLEAQLDVLAQAHVRGFFLPGNHDWDGGGAAGLAAIRRQAEFLAASARAEVALLPGDGCAGPAQRDLGDRLHLVLLDTAAWLAADPRCATGGADPGASLARAVARPADAPRRQVVVLAHHPLASGGPHGGYFTWREHLFPLRSIDRRLWIPVPVLGSLYPAWHWMGLGKEDLAAPAYRAMRAAVTDALRTAPPLLYASGHEHSLQLLEGTSARYLLVSGAGSVGRLTRVHAITGTLFAKRAPGYARLDAFADGAVRLTIVAITHVREEHVAVCLDPGPGATR